MKYIFFFFAMAIMTGCQKKGDTDSCSGIGALTIGVKSPVQAGSSISLVASSLPGAQYYLWEGPAGFTSSEQSPVINNVQSGNAGRYTLRVGFTGGCVRTATTDSVVITIPAAPCAPADNTTSLDGVSNISFYAVSGAPSGGSYFITGNGLEGDVELEFPGNAKPVPGVYSIQPLGGDWLAGNVRLRAVSQSSNWASATGKVYVSVASNKVTAVFCNIPVTGQTFGFNTTMSGRVREK